MVKAKLYTTEFRIEFFDQAKGNMDSVTITENGKKSPAACERYGKKWCKENTKDKKHGKKIFTQATAIEVHADIYEMTNEEFFAHAHKTENAKGVNE